MCSPRSLTSSLSAATTTDSFLFADITGFPLLFVDGDAQCKYVVELKTSIEYIDQSPRGLPTELRVASVLPSFAMIHLVVSSYYGAALPLSLLGAIGSIAVLPDLSVRAGGEGGGAVARRFWPRSSLAVTRNL